MAQLTGFGERISAAQLDKKMSSRALAKKMNMAEPQLYSLKTKTKSPREETIARLAKALGKPAEFFAVADQAAPKSVAKPAAAPKTAPVKAAVEAVPVKAKPRQAAPAARSSAAAGSNRLKAFVVFELDGEIVSRKPITRLPPDFEL